ncbi:MAG: tyrosine-type recombinase/integrase [Acidobacteriota bacterium]
MEKLPSLEFESLLAEPISEYLDYLAHLGYAVVTPAHQLRRLDRFWARHGITNLDQLPVNWFLQLQEEDPRLAKDTWRGVRQTFRRFCGYLVRRQRIKKDLISAWPRPVLGPYCPYVFSLAEIRLIFDYFKGLVTQADDRARFYQRYSDYTLYHLIYACGLRVSEAVRLSVNDYCAQEATLWVRPSKFGKSRLLPIGRRVDLNLTNLLGLRRRWFPRLGNAPLFLFCPEGRPYTRRRVSDYFRDCLRKLGIYRPLQIDQGVRYGTPHLHELRRAFAVHRLLAWYREGADLDAKLPLLATYMGHAHFGHTKTYLPLTEELLSEAAGRFAGRFDRLDWVENDSELR